MIVIPNRGKVVALITALALAGGLLTLALLAKPTQAQATQNRVEFEGPIDFNVFNPCNNDELVPVTGQFRGFTLEVDTPTDQANAKIHVEVTGTGEGTLGNNYVFSDTQNQQFKEGPPTTFLMPSHLISQGSDDNFVLTARYRLTGNGEYEFDGLMGTQCRG